MAGRVNTKFVVALIVVLTTVPVLLISYYYLFLRTNPEKLIARGDEYLAQGLADRAVEQYGKALMEKTDDVGLTLKYVHALTQVKTSDPRTARRCVGQMIASLHKAITQEPRNPVPFEKLMQLYMKLGHDIGDFESWHRMYEDADARLRAGTDPHGTTLAKKFRGIARVNRMERLDLTKDEREQARADLTAVLEQSPDDRDANYYLAAWHVLAARAAQRDGGDQPGEKDEHFKQADELTAASLKAQPDDPRRQLDRLRVLGLIGKNNKEYQKEVSKLLDQVEQRLNSRPVALRLVLELVELLPQLDRNEVRARGGGLAPTTSGLLRAEKVLRAMIQNHPTELRYVATLGRVLEAQRRYDKAIEQFKQVYELQPSTDAFEGIQLDGLRSGAMVKFVDLTLKRLTTMSQMERQKAIEEVEELMGHVVANYGESPHVTLLQGKIAMARGQWGQASSKLDRANSQFKGAVPEALWLSAKAWVQMGELGAATDRLEQLIQVRPDYSPARYELVRLYLRLNQVSEAGNHLDMILKIEPDAPQAMRLHADLLAQNGQTEQAIDAYLSLDPEKNPELIPVLAGLYVAAGDSDSAIQILEERFKQDPKDLEVLQMLVRVSRDTDQATGYVRTAREAGADAQALDILESQFEGKSSLAQVVEGLIDTEGVPFRRHLKRYRLFRRMGQTEQAIGELEQAAKLEPDHPMVISAQFDQMLAQRDWDRAETLASRASTSNIDMAEGMFYFGRLEATRGRYDRAIASYRRGLSLRKIYSEGWRQLGDVQRLTSDWHGAVASYGMALEQRPNNVAALGGLAMAFHALDKQNDALDKLRLAVKFQPNNRKLREQYLSYEQRYGDVKEALSLRQNVAMTQKKDTENRRALAILFAKAGQVDQANRVIDALIEETGRNRSNLMAAAAVRNAIGDSDGAQTLLQDHVNGLGSRATDEDWMMLARFLVSVGNDDHAAAAYRQAVEVEDPDLRRATREFADLLFERGQYSEAVRRYEQLWETAPDDKRVGYRFVEALLRVNEPERAHQVLTVVTKKHGVDGGTFVLEALIARVNDDTDAALAALNRAVELDPRRAMTYYQRADLQVADPTVEKSVMEDLDKALELDPDLGAARRLLATIHVRRGEPVDAIRELRTLIRRRPRHVAARLQLAGLYMDGGQQDLRRALLNESAKLFPKSAIWPQLQAQQALLDKNMGSAIEHLEQAYALSRSPQTLGELSALLIEYGKAQEALSLLRGEGEVVRRVPLLHALRGRALVELEEMDLAGRAFARAVEQSRSFKDLVGVAMQMSHGLGWDKTIAQLEQRAQGTQAGMVELAIVQIQVETKAYDLAMERLGRIDVLIPENSPERVQYDRLLALTLYQQQQYDQAFAVYKQMLQRQPNNLVTLNNAAYLLAEDLGRADEAVPLAQRAAKLAPDNSLVLDTLGWTLFKAGQVDQALHTLIRSVQIKPSPLNCLHLADVLQAQGDIDAAAKRLTQAKKLAEQSDDQQSLWLASKRLDEISGSVGP